MAAPSAAAHSPRAAPPPLAAVYRSRWQLPLQQRTHHAPRPLSLQRCTGRGGSSLCSSALTTRPPPLPLQRCTGGGGSSLCSSALTMRRAPSPCSSVQVEMAAPSAAAHSPRAAPPPLAAVYIGEATMGMLQDAEYEIPYLRKQVRVCQSVAGCVAKRNKIPFLRKQVCKCAKARPGVRQPGTPSSSSGASGSAEQRMLSQAPEAGQLQWCSNVVARAVLVAGPAPLRVLRAAARAGRAAEPADHGRGPQAGGVRAERARVRHRVPAGGRGRGRARARVRAWAHPRPMVVSVLGSVICGFCDLWVLWRRKVRGPPSGPLVQDVSIRQVNTSRWDMRPGRPRIPEPRTQKGRGRGALHAPQPKPTPTPEHRTQNTEPNGMGSAPHSPPRGRSVHAPTWTPDQASNMSRPKPFALRGGAGRACTPTPPAPPAT